MPRIFLMESNPKKKEESKKDKFEWADEGVSTLVRVIILGWSATILTLNYVTIPGVPQRNIDPTFIASVFTGTLATFGVVPAKKDKKEDDQKKLDTKEKVENYLSYREPHLQKKSDECAELWREWFSFFEDPEKKHSPETKELRKKWCNCVTEFGEMVSQEVKTNPRYKDLNS